MLQYHTTQQACYNIKNKIIKIVKKQETQKIIDKEEEKIHSEEYHHVILLSRGRGNVHFKLSVSVCQDCTPRRGISWVLKICFSQVALMTFSCIFKYSGELVSNGLWLTGQNTDIWHMLGM